MGFDSVDEPITAMTSAAADRCRLAALDFVGHTDGSERIVT